MDNYVIEVCLDSVPSACYAQEGGAKRVELCDNLFEGGTTPSIGCIRLARRMLTIGLQVIIRPRGGDFLYSDLEYQIMKEDIIAAKGEGADGVVIGLLHADGRVDIERTAELTDLARPMNVTFHRAFDMTSDPYLAMEDIITAGCDRILTSGQEGTVIEGIDLIKSLVDRSAGKIIIMPGGGITARNFKKIKEVSGAREFHIYAVEKLESPMTFRRDHVFMGGTLSKPEFMNHVTDKEAVKSIAKAR